MKPQKNNLMIFSLVAIVAIVAISLFFMSSKGTFNGIFSSDLDSESAASDERQNLVGSAQECRRPPSCEDSDEDDEGSIKGYVTVRRPSTVQHPGCYPIERHEDTCYSTGSGPSTSVQEQVCDRIGGYEHHSTLPFQCPPGETCNDGACSSDAITCADTDNTYDDKFLRPSEEFQSSYYKPGFSVVKTGSGTVLQKTGDICDFSGQVHKVIETDCDNDQNVIFTTHDCPSACVYDVIDEDPGNGYGHCLKDKDYCTENDKGQNYILKGTTTHIGGGSTETKIDSCESDGSTLHEFYCGSDGKTKDVFINCKTCDSSGNCQGNCKEGRCKNYIGLNPSDSNPDQITPENTPPVVCAGGCETTQAQSPSSGSGSNQQGNPNGAVTQTPSAVTLTSGDLRVTANIASASVYVDNLLKGQTSTKVPYSFTVKGLSATNHNLRVTKTGYVASSQSVSIIGGIDTSVYVTLTSSK